MLYDLKLVGLNADEIEFLATMMEIKGIGMGDASKYVDSMPSMIFEGIDATSAQKYKAMLEGVGAVIEVSHTGSEQSEPVEQPAAKPVVEAVSEPVAVPQPEPVVSAAPAQEAPKQTRTIPVIPSEETEPEPEAEPLPKPIPVEMPAQSVFQINDPNVTPEPASEEPVYFDMHGSCPKCGSTFVSAKKVAGLFGGNKIKYVCSACKHKF